MFTVTARLIDATQALCAFGSLKDVHETRRQLALDCKSRAREVCQAIHVGQELEPFKVEFLQCLRSRLEDFDIAQLPVAREWLDAFSEAYGASVALPA